MATKISNWSSTAADNNAAPPNGAPEGMPPSTVNNVMRENMAAIRDWYIDPDWICFGDGAFYVSSTSFRIAATNVTARYAVGRRVRAIGSSTGTIYGTITVSAFSTDTTVTVVWDSGTLANETLEISVGSPASGLPSIASQVFYDKTVSGLTATNVKTALDELSSEKIGTDTIPSIKQIAPRTSNGTTSVDIDDAGGSIIKNNTSAYSWTIPPNATEAIPVGSAVTLVNLGSAGNITITRGSGVVLRWMNGGGADANRTLAPYGQATIYKVATDTWTISGSGLS